MNFIKSFYKYNSDVRKKYLDAIEKLPWEEAVKDRGASFGSIRNIFLHVLDAYRGCFQYVLVPVLSGTRKFSSDSFGQVGPIDPTSFHNIEEMRAFERKIDSMVMDFVGNLKGDDLSLDFVIDDRKETVESILMHMIEEELQHRGELNCLFWQLDIDPPITAYGD